MVDPRPLNRQQLSAFLKDPESIRRFERLFEIVGQVTPEQLRALAILIEEVGIEATNASAKANSALSLIDNLDNDVVENLGLKALNEIDVLKSEVLPRYTPKNEDYIDFPIAPYVETDRRLAWDNENLTLTMGLVNYQLKIGQNTIFCVKNVSGATINKGQSVMATGVLGASAKIEAGLAIADGSINAMMMLGVAAQDIANNAFGYVTQFGKVRGFNTTGATYGETWADGDVLYFNPNVAGGLTKVAPTAPDLNLPIAYVLNASAGSGSIFVRMKQGEYLNELHDVAITSPVANQALIFNGTVWLNTNIVTLSGNNIWTGTNKFLKTFTDWTVETFNATQTLNALNPACTTTLTGNMTLNAVSNSTTGEMQVIVRAYTQDATGGRTFAFNTSVFSASGASFPQPTPTANRVSLFQFTKMPDGKWAVQSLNDVRST